MRQRPGQPVRMAGQGGGRGGIAGRGAGGSGPASRAPGPSASAARAGPGGMSRCSRGGRTSRRAGIFGGDPSRAAGYAPIPRRCRWVPLQLARRRYRPRRRCRGSPRRRLPAPAPAPPLASNAKQLASLQNLTGRPSPRRCLRSSGRRSARSSWRSRPGRSPVKAARDAEANRAAFAQFGLGGFHQLADQADDPGIVGRRRRPAAQPHRPAASSATISVLVPPRSMPSCLAMPRRCDDLGCAPQVLLCPDPGAGLGKCRKRCSMCRGCPARCRS